MRSSIVTALLLVACSSQSVVTGEAPERDKGGSDAPAVKATKVAGAVYMLEGRGGNIAAVVGPDGVLIVDDQVPGAAEAIRGAIAALSDAPVRWVVNTHWHWDHTGTNADFGRSSTIIAHENVRLRMSTPQDVRGEIKPPSPDHALPVVTYSDGLRMHVGAEEVRVEHVAPGHTDGDSYVHFETSNVVHLGDEFFTERFPYVDLGSGGDVVQLEKNISKVLASLSPDTKIIPGHGRLATVADLEGYRDMLVETIDAVREQKRSGKKPEAITIDEKWTSWGTGYIKTPVWISTIYESLGDEA